MSDHAHESRMADDAELGMVEHYVPMPMPSANYTFLSSPPISPPPAAAWRGHLTQPSISPTETPLPSGYTSRTASISDIGHTYKEHKIDLIPDTPSAIPLLEKAVKDNNEKRSSSVSDYCPVSAEALIPIPRPAKGAPPPPKHEVAFSIKAKIWYNTYRKFFTIAVTLNLIGVILRFTGHFDYAKKHAGAMVLGNLATAILVRNELFGRFLYLTANTLFAKWTPLWFRLGITSTFQHLGGIHSGCAVSGFTWLTINVVEVYVHHGENHEVILVFGLLTNIAIAIGIASAIPWVRNTHHNVFERWHRFIGWAGIVFTWLFVLLSDLWDWDTQSFQGGGWRVFYNQGFWFALCMLAFVVWPWLTVRKVPVEVEIPSPKVAVVKFQRGIQQGLLGRISRSAVKEYHAFGTISAGVDSGCHYMICGVQGDFTKSLVNNPPTHLWTRELKFAAVGNTSTLYKRGIRICTGTGLGAALSTCIQSPNWFLIWIGSEQEKTFGPTISALIYDNLGPERVLLWDSKARGGRPDTMKILKEVYKTWNAEVVMITSNYEGNKEMMEGCKEAGIPAFGTLWDF